MRLRSTRRGLSDKVISLLGVLKKEVEEGRLPIALCAIVILSASAICYWLGYSGFLALQQFWTPL